MATSDIKISEGAGKNVAMYSFPEDAETKQIQRVALNDLNGAIAILPGATDINNVSNGGVMLAPLFKLISCSTSGVNIVVAAVGGKKIRVMQWDIKVNAAVNFKWQSHTAGDITGLYYNSAPGDGISHAFSQIGYFETVSGESLDLNLSSATAVGGSLAYVLV